MGMNFTTTESVNGWSNVLTLLRSAGYEGNGIVKSLTVVNNSATAAYLHFTSDGASNPATAADGLEVSTNTSFSYTAEKCDLATTWVNTGSALDIKFSVI